MGTCVGVALYVMDNYKGLVVLHRTFMFASI